jgi:hypothetical protein
MTTISAFVERPPKTHRELIDTFESLAKNYGGDLGCLIMGEIVALQDHIEALEQRLERLEAKRR